MIDRYGVDSSIGAYLEEVTEHQIGFGEVPAAVPQMPYAILNPSASPPPTGTWADDAQDWEFVIHMKSVGRGPEQAQWMSDKVRAALLARTDGPLDLATYLAGLNLGFSLMWLQVSNLGDTVSTGDVLYEVNDLYRVKVTPA